MKHAISITVLLAAFVLSSIGSLPTASAQSFGTWAEYYHAADAVLVVNPAFVEPPPLADRPIVETVQVLKDSTGSFAKGSRFALSQTLSSTSDKSILLFGWKADNENYIRILRRGLCCVCRPGSSVKPVFKGVHWDQCGRQDLGPSAIQYVVNSPPPTVASNKRLEYFGKFLESGDPAVSADAFAEFANAIDDPTFQPPAMLRPEQIRRWLLDPNTPVHRQGVYGLMLGMCGDPVDASVLERRIADPDDERRVGIEGLMAGYLLLKGEAGLKFLETVKLADRTAPDGEIYSVVMAIRFVRRNGNGTIAPERLNAATKLLLDRTEFIETAVTDLARAKDWSLHDRLMQLYRAGDDDRTLKRVIVRYMIASTRDISKDAKELPRHAQAGQDCLTEIRQRDPKLVAEIEKYFFLQ